MNNRCIAFLSCLIPSAALLACSAAGPQQSPDDVNGGAPGGGAPAMGAGGAAPVGAGASVGAVAGSGPVNMGAGGSVPMGAGGSAILPPTGGTGPVGTGGTIGVGGATSPGGATSMGGAPPVSGTEYTFTTGHFSVPPGGEVYKCQDFTNPFGKDIGIVQDHTDLTPGSHHMFAFVLPNSQLTLQGSLADCPSGGVEFHDYLTTSATPSATTVYPADTGRVLPAGDGVRLNVHLINTGTAQKDAFVVYKVTYVDPATLKNKAGSIFLNQVALQVPLGMSTQSKSYTLTQDINLMGDASHMHSRGIRFVATASSGQTLYDGTDWAEPKPQTFDPALHLSAGTKITWSCTYNNDSNAPLMFGESASANEMCIFVGSFYNATGQQISYQAIF